MSRLSLRHSWGGTGGGALKRSLTHYERQKVRASYSRILNTLLIYHYSRGRLEDGKGTWVAVEWFIELDTNWFVFAFEINKEFIWFRIILNQNVGEPLQHICSAFLILFLLILHKLCKHFLLSSRLYILLIYGLYIVYIPYINTPSTHNLSNDFPTYRLGQRLNF